nr:hypothetical protein [Desulfobacula sp.]
MYELSCNLMEAAAGRTKEISELDREIDTLEKKILGTWSPKPVGEEFILDIIEDGIKNESGMDSKKRNLYSQGLSGSCIRNSTILHMRKALKCLPWKAGQPDGKIQTQTHSS